MRMWKPVAAAAAVFIASAAQAADHVTTRTLDQLKAEVIRRASEVPPRSLVDGMKLPDVREALGQINSLDRDEWARAWMAIGDRYMAAGRAAEQAGRIKEAREDYITAYRYFKFGHYPTDNSPDKKRSYAKGLEAFLAYGRHLDPPLEVVKIPFEGKEIVGYLRLPKGTRPAPLVYFVTALDFAQGRMGRTQPRLSRSRHRHLRHRHARHRAGADPRQRDRRADALARDRLFPHPAGDRRQAARLLWRLVVGLLGDQDRGGRARAAQRRGRAGPAGASLLHAGMAEGRDQDAGISDGPVAGAGLGLWRRDAGAVFRLRSQDVAEEPGRARAAKRRRSCSSTGRAIPRCRSTISISPSPSSRARSSRPGSIRSASTWAAAPSGRCSASAPTSWCRSC